MQKQKKRNYVLGTIIVLLVMIALTTFLLNDTSYLTPMYAVFLVGIIWFLLIVPRFFLTSRL